jgi:hypothetical protein
MQDDKASSKEYSLYHILKIDRLRIKEGNMSTIQHARFGRVRAMLYLYTAKSGGSLSLALAPSRSRKRSGDERLVLKSALLQGNEEVPPASSPLSSRAIK